MSEVNLDIFLEEIANKKILENVTKYCCECYNELNENEKIYFDIQKYNYLCFKCAYKKTQKEIEVLNKKEQDGLF